MNPFTRTDGRIAATAIVTVTLEITIGPVWDTQDLKTLHAEAARQAVRNVRDALKDHAKVRDVMVRSVLTDDREEPEAAP